MFNKPKAKDETSHEQAPAASPSSTPKPRKVSGVPSIISADLQITGDLNSQGDVQIDGHVDGDVRADSLTIGEAGSVHGVVRADKVRVCGKVVGQIDAGSVTLVASAPHVEGDVVHDRLAIEPGAHLEGHCRRRGAGSGKGAQAGKATSGAKSDETAGASAKANGAASTGADKAAAGDEAAPAH